MNGHFRFRFCSLLIGAVIASTSTASWAQVPIVTPQQVRQPSDIPIVRTDDILSLPTQVPIVKKGGLGGKLPPGQKNSETILGVALPPGDDKPEAGSEIQTSNSKLLPAIVRPGNPLPPIVKIDGLMQALPSATPPASQDVLPIASPNGLEAAPGIRAALPASEIPIIRAEPISNASAADTNSPFTPQLESALAPVVKPRNIALSNAETVVGFTESEDPEMNAAQPTLLPMSFVQDENAKPMNATPIVPATPFPLEQMFPRSATGTGAIDSNPAGGTQLPAHRTTGPSYMEGPIAPYRVPEMRGTLAAPQFGEGLGQSENRMLPANWRMAPGFSGEMPEMNMQEPVPNELAIQSNCQHCGGVGCEYCQGAMEGPGHVFGDGSMVDSSGCWDECEPGCFGFMPCARKYLIVDGLRWTRNDGGVTGTNFGGVSDYDWEYGWRVTLGQRIDSINGYELGFFGFLPFDAQRNQTSFVGAIDANFIPAGGFGGAQVGAFFNAVETTQTIQTRLHGIELNRVRWGWDVVQSSIGLRYMWFEDDYRLQSRNIFGNTGTLSLSAINQLIGPEIGLSLFYDVGRRLSFSGFGKLGGYLNFYRTDLDLINGGVHFLSNRHSDTNLSASFDLGANAHLHIASGVRLRAGYGALWLWDVTSSADNFPAVLAPTTGFTPDETGSVFFHGLNIGLEIYR